MKNNKSASVLMLSSYYFPTRGGQAKQATVLAEQLATGGSRVEVIAERQDLAWPSEEIVNGVHIRRFRQPSQARRKTGFRRSVMGMIILGCKVVARLLACNRWVDLCVVRTVSFHAFLTGVLRATGLIRYKTIVVAETGGADDEITYLLSMPFSAVIIFFIKKNDYFNCNNKDNDQHFRALGIKSSAIQRIYNGIDTTPFTFSVYPTRIRSFSFLAELNKEKGIRELLSAFESIHQEYPETHLIIGGYGPEEDYVSGFMNKRSLQNAVSFVGFVSEQKKTAFFHLSDCFVFPSYSEGFGLVVAEAVAHKRVVITTRVADFEEIYGDAIYYCGKQDSIDLRAKMASLIEEYDPKSIDYSMVIPKLDIDRAAREFLALTIEKE